MKCLAMAAVTVLSATFLVLGVGCEHGSVYVGASTPAYAAGYDYYYYPDNEVYFYPRDNVYFWNDGHHWNRDRRLPDRYHIDSDHHVNVHLNSARPYDFHDRTRVQYPRAARRCTVISNSLF